MAMRISKKCHYALRAAFELASRRANGPVPVQEIAAAQDMPARFLEAVLNDLRQARVVVSQRGNAGGYMLAAPPEEITVADVMEAIQGPISVSAMPGEQHDGHRYVRGDDALDRLWTAMNESLAEVGRGTSLADLVRTEQRSERRPVPDYSI